MTVCSGPNAIPMQIVQRSCYDRLANTNFSQNFCLSPNFLSEFPSEEGLSVTEKANLNLEEFNEIQ